MKTTFRLLFLATALVVGTPSITLANCDCTHPSRSSNTAGATTSKGRPAHDPVTPNSIFVTSAPVTINNMSANAAPTSVVRSVTVRSVPAAPAQAYAPTFVETHLSGGNQELLLAALIAAAVAALIAIIFFWFGQWLAQPRKDKRTQKPGEWLDIGGSGPHGPGTIDIEVRVRVKGATWSWQRVSRQKLIDHLNSVPLVRDSLLETAPAGHAAASGGGPVATVVNQGAH